MQAYDELKNKRLSGGDDFRVHLLGPAGVVTHASLDDKDDGTYLVTYSCTAAGIHDLHVTIGMTANIADLGMISVCAAKAKAHVLLLTAASKLLLMSGNANSSVQC